MRKDKEDRLAAAAVLATSDEVKKFNSRDTGAWCKGKRGRDHKGEWHETPHGWRHFICSNCGKFLGYDFTRFDSDYSGHLSSELRRLRKAMNVTQDELASRANTDQTTISSIETLPYYRQNEVRLSTWKNLFEALGQKLVVVVVPSEDALRRLEYRQQMSDRETQIQD